MESHRTISLRRQWKRNQKQHKWSDFSNDRYKTEKKHCDPSLPDKSFNKQGRLFFTLPKGTNVRKIIQILRFYLNKISRPRMRSVTWNPFPIKRLLGWWLVVSPLWRPGCFFGHNAFFSHKQIYENHKMTGIFKPFRTNDRNVSTKKKIQVETSHLNAGMYKFESSQKDESRAQSAYSSKAYNKPRDFNAQRILRL